ncbi:hypothetical protein [Nocardioides sp.]|uniref:hypothetical protein n=1 Tax=Nocardioides sp. TaxID=35761 RepID=UPI00271625C9|nr:hypothetical protein [Nocardioides sp.]MDO9456851.1 hypothetical protein [Nocardioides sp.]
MTEDQFDPQNSTADLTSEPTAPGTADGNPTEGVEIDEAEQAEAVVPDDKSIDGPPAGHA